MASDSFGSCLEHCLEHMRHVVTSLTKFLYFKGNLASLQCAIPPRCYDGPFFLFTQSAIYTKRLVARAHTPARASASWFPGGVNDLWARTWKTAKFKTVSLEVEPECLTIDPTPEGLLMIIYSSASHFPSRRVNPFGTAPLSVQN